ncbi:MAG: hypothetical protein M1825_006338 [Sarcosagium campestre]|nr:MAG: hypothetical protein M1825_006338 [Sarcosagium campestre]
MWGLKNVAHPVSWDPHRQQSRARHRLSPQPDVANVPTTSRNPLAENVSRPRPMSLMARLTDPMKPRLVIRSDSMAADLPNAALESAPEPAPRRHNRSSVVFKEKVKGLGDTFRRVRITPSQPHQQAPPSTLPNQPLASPSPQENHKTILTSLTDEVASRSANAKRQERERPRRPARPRWQARVESYAGSRGHATYDDLFDVRIGEEAQSGASHLTQTAKAWWSTADPFSLFPSEISIRILAHLDAQSLRGATEVCRRWHRIASTPTLWRSLYMSRYPQVSPDLASTDAFTLASARSKHASVQDRNWKHMLRARDLLQQRWHEGSPSESIMLYHLHSVYCLQFDDSKIITGSGDSTFNVWDTKSHTCKLAVGCRRRKRIDFDNPIAHAGSSGSSPSPDISEIASHSSSRDTDTPSSFEKKRLSSVSPLSGSGSRASAAVLDGPVHIIPGLQHTASILCLQYDKDILVTGSSDTTCIVWSIADNYAPIRQLKHHSGNVFAVCLNAFFIVSCSRDKLICIWSRQTGRMLQALRGHNASVQAIQMRGERLVSASNDGVIKLWKIYPGAWVRDFVVPSAGGTARPATSGISCLFFTEDARRIIAGYHDGNIRLWDAGSGACTREFDPTCKHLSMVRCLHMDTASGRVATGGYDSSVKIWDVATGRQIGQHLRQHSDELDDMVVDVKIDYRRVVVALIDGRVISLDFGWDVPGVEALAR